jgi:hypothetical protein
MKVQELAVLLAIYPNQAEIVIDGDFEDGELMEVERAYNDKASKFPNVNKRLGWFKDKAGSSVLILQTKNNTLKEEV